MLHILAFKPETVAALVPQQSLPTCTQHHTRRATLFYPEQMHDGHASPGDCLEPCWSGISVPVKAPIILAAHQIHFPFIKHK